MKPSSPARKYGPLIFIAAAQLVVALVAPSVASTSAAGGSSTGTAYNPAAGTAYNPSAGTAYNPSTGTSDAGGTAAAGGAAPTDTSAASDPSAGGAVTGTGTTGGTPTTAVGQTPSAGGSTPSTATGKTTTIAKGKTAATTKPAAAAGNAGDTSHCVDGRQFDPAIDYYAPPCVPGVPGAAQSNPGATSTGVTATSIEVVQYIPTFSPEVNTLLKAEGLYYDTSTAQPASQAFSDFINSHYQLYGRKINVQLVQGTCTTVPPDTQCLTGEFDKIVAQYHPFALYFEATECSACFAELARLHVVAVGADGFSQDFHAGLAPYVYSAGADSTSMALATAEYYCKSLANRNAIYAVNGNPAQNFSTMKRSVGIVGLDDPDVEAVVKNVFVPALAKCGISDDGHEYFYDPDLNTATQQGQAGTAKMNTTQDPATTIVCFCDVAAPEFIWNAFYQNNYWPEILDASTMGMDDDAVAQQYRSTVACPTTSRGCTYDGEFGLAPDAPDTPPAQLAGVKVYAAESKSTNNLPPTTTNVFWTNYSMLADLIEETGPNLTPANMAASAKNLGTRGGGVGQPTKSFASGTFSWIQDFTLNYFDATKTSVENNTAGAYVAAYNGQRFAVGNLPTGDPAGVIPVAAKRS